VQNVTIAAIQMNALCARTETNIERHEALARRAAKRGAELICFPELSLTGHHVRDDAWKHTEEVPGGPAYRRIEALARDLGVIISAGIGERENTVAYNTQFLVGPDGFIGKYRKTHASRDEYFFFRMGGQFPVFDIGPCRVGILICYDIIFPEVARCLALNGAEVILAPHASRCGPTKPRDEGDKSRGSIDFFTRIGWARSSENGVFMVMNNQAGDAGRHIRLNSVHAGGVVITDPMGEVVAKSRTRSFREELVVTTLEGKQFTQSRTRACLPLQTRRPEIYEAIVRPT
jgi:predicted amidohydrolase